MKSFAAVGAGILSSIGNARHWQSGHLGVSRIGHWSIGGALAERGRKPGFRMSDEHRVKIQNSNILNALVEHVEGKREMSATQVSAGLGLLRKIMPDLATTTVQGDEDGGPLVITWQRS